MAWITEHPPASVDLDSCVTCGLCLPVCPTFRLTGDETASPRGRLTAIGAVDAGLAGVDQRFADITGFCLQCQRQLKRAVKQARQVALLPFVG